MKKLRSDFPRRKRSKISPIVHSSPSPTVPGSIASSQLTGEVSCITSRFSKNNPKAPSLKKRRFEERRETKENERLRREEEDREVELSESSCVDSCSGFGAEKGSSKTKRTTGKGVGSRVGESEGTLQFEVSHAQQLSAGFSEKILNCDGEKLETNQSYCINDSDVISVNSLLKFPMEEKFGNIVSFINRSFDGAVLREGQNKVIEEVSEISPNCVQSNLKENSQPIVDLVSVDFDLACSEYLSCEDDVCEYPSADFSIFAESSELELSSEYSQSTLNDSGSQFSAGDTSPSATFQLFLLYGQQFHKSTSSKISSRVEDEESHDITLRLEEEHLESYRIMRKRERRQVYLHDYAEEYCTATNYGQVIFQQRLQMVHWIVEQCCNKEFHKETMFLGVSLLDRFLSKGYFNNKRNLQIAGIACLTLAIRIEENQPFNSVQQKAFHVGINEYSRPEVVAMEWMVQEVLDFQCLLPTIYNFLWFYLRAVSADENVEKTSKYLASLSLLGHEQLCYWPSTVAAALVILACVSTNEDLSCRHQIVEIHSRSRGDDLHKCMKSLQWLVKYVS